MPQVTVYVREEDLPRWKSVEKKSEFIHEALVGSLTISPLPLRAPIEQPFVPKPPDPETGYPCCTKAKPCKHWAFDGAESVWRNELTGKTREVI